MYHLIYEYQIGDTSPPIPGQLLAQILLPKKGKVFWVFWNRLQQALEG
jgi:hypothetical protein